MPDAPAPPCAPPSLAAVIPALDAATTIGSVVRGTLRHVPRVVVVDDGSTDGTAAAARAAGAEVVRHPANRGKGAALQTGFDHLGSSPFDAIVTLDADGQHDPGDIPLLVDRFRRDRPAIVVGSRAARFEAMPPLRRGMNRFSSAAVRYFAGLDLPDSQSGFRLYDAAFLARARLARDARYEAEMMLLMEAAASGRAVASEPVRAPIVDGRPTSHYRTLRDTFRIIGAVLSRRRGHA